MPQARPARRPRAHCPLRARIASGVRSQAIAAAGSPARPGPLMRGRTRSARGPWRRRAPQRSARRCCSSRRPSWHPSRPARPPGSGRPGSARARRSRCPADHRVVLDVAHRDQAVDARYAEPVQHVRHQLLEAHVLDAGDALGALEVGRGAVAARLALARVVDQELGHLAERPALLAVVDDQRRRRRPGRSRCTPRCRAPDRAGRCRCPSRTRPSRCTRRAPGRRPSCPARRAWRGRRRCRRCGRRSAAGTPRRSGRVTSSGNMPPVCSNRWRRRLLSETPQRCGDAGQIPDRLDRDLGAVDLAGRGHDPAVRLDLVQPDGVLELGHGEARLGHGDGRADVPAGGELLGERLADHVAPRVERDDPGRVGPLRMRPDRHGRCRVGEIGSMQRVQAAGWRSPARDRAHRRRHGRRSHCAGWHPTSVPMTGPRAAALAAPQVTFGGLARPARGCEVRTICRGGAGRLVSFISATMISGPRGAAHGSIGLVAYSAFPAVRHWPCRGVSLICRRGADRTGAFGIDPNGSEAMRLLRYGPRGAEKPGLVGRRGPDSRSVA